MTGIESELLARLRKLPPHRVVEVVDFVEFLVARETGASVARRFTDELLLDSLNLPPICADAILGGPQSVRP
jgi:hypothetical protein